MEKKVTIKDVVEILNALEEDKKLEPEAFDGYLCALAKRVDQAQLEQLDRAINVSPWDLSPEKLAEWKKWARGENVEY